MENTEYFFTPDSDIRDELLELKELVVNKIGVLLSNIPPTFPSIDAITSTLRSIVMDWTMVPCNSIIPVTNQLEKLIISTLLVLEE